LATVEQVRVLRAEFEPHDGLLVIGGDGSSELIGFDLRRDPPPVVLLNITSAGWASALHQAPDFSTFWRQVTSDGFRFIDGYE
jgi:hypothetical protein